MIRLELPYPPSANTYWRSVVINNRVRVLLSRKGREYKMAVQHACAAAGIAGKRITHDVAIVISLYPPDRRRRDIDNSVKPLLDALTSAGVWLDDSQVCELTVKRMAIVRGGSVDMQINVEA